MLFALFSISTMELFAQNLPVERPGQSIKVNTASNVILILPDNPDPLEEYAASEFLSL